MILSKLKQKVTLISGDILDNSKLVTSMKNHDIVIHLAAQISVPASIKNPKLNNFILNCLKALFHYA